MRTLYNLAVLLGVLLATYSAKAQFIKTYDISSLQIPQEEYEALVSFYHSTGGPEWTRRTGWLENNFPSEWYGLTV